MPAGPDKSPSSVPCAMAGRTLLHRATSIALALFLALFISLFTSAAHPGSTAWADVGGFAGDDDYGDSWTDNSWDDDDDDDYSWSWDDDDDDDWSWGGNTDNDDYSYDYSSSSDDDDVTVIIGAIVFVAVVILIWRAKSGTSKRRKRTQPPSSTAKTQRPAGASITPDSQLKPVSTLQQRDPAFSAAAVEDLIANVYVQMQAAWTACDFEPMRPYFDNTLFAQLSNQLSMMRAKGRTNYVEKIAVLDTHVRGWFESQGQEHLIMRVRTRITDYTVENASGKVISGNPDAELFMEYEYTLSRAAGTKTNTGAAQVHAGECPNCGAPLDLAQSARCPYCGSVVETSAHTWVISKIKGISQRTA